MPAHDEGGGAAPGEHGGQDRGHCEAGAADQGGAGAGGVGQRGQVVDRGRDAEGAPDGRGVPQAVMVVRGEGEPDAGLGDAPGDLGGVQVQGDAERLDDVGGPALAGDGAASVLDDPGPGGGGHQGGHGGDVDGVRAVAPGPDHVGHGRAVDGQGDDAVHEGVEHPAEFRCGLALGPQRGQESRELGRLVGVVHDLGHRPAGVLRTQVLARQQRGEQARPGASRRGHHSPLRAGRAGRRDPASGSSLSARMRAHGRFAGAGAGPWTR